MIRNHSSTIRRTLGAEAESGLTDPPLHQFFLIAKGLTDEPLSPAEKKAVLWQTYRTLQQEAPPEHSRKHKRPSPPKPRALSRSTALNWLTEDWQRKTVSDVESVVKIVNGFATLGAIQSRSRLYSRLVTKLDSIPDGLKAMVEHILETEPAARGHILPPFSVVVVELIALALVVEHMTVNGISEWARGVLDALRGPRGPLPPIPRPFGAPVYHAADSELVQRLATALAFAAPAALARIRRCAFPPCLDGQHTCRDSAPYFVTPRSDRNCCCDPHSKKELRRRARARKGRGVVSPRKRPF